MKSIEYHLAERRFQSEYSRHRESLSPEAREQIESLMNAAELEMACESLVLSLLEEEILLNDESKHKLLQLCGQLGLERDSVYRHDFWAIAQQALSGRGDTDPHVPSQAKVSE